MSTIQQAEYRASYPRVSKCPEDPLPEYAFIGRSNVGKSSLINMLTGRKDLARVSKKPGKTQMINYYLINGGWHLVDLPGYGYAVASKKTRAKWGRMIEDYLRKRDKLMCAFVLIDANIDPQPIDVDFMNWCGKNRVPFVIVYTKTDRLSKGAVERNIHKIRQELLRYWNELPQEFVSSSTSGEGRDEILAFIEEINQNFR